MKKTVHISICCANKSIEVSLFLAEKELMKYIFMSKYHLSEMSRRLCVITMLRWAICENINANYVIQNYALLSSEIEYINSEIKLLLELLSKNISDIHNFQPLISCAEKNSLSFHPVKYMNESITLGFSDGKDSACCLLLLKKAGYRVEKMCFDFDEAEFVNDFHTKCVIIDAELCQAISTADIFRQNKMSYYQEEDMHIIYLAPILLSHYKGYYTKMCCGIQWDMLASTVNSITISESFASLEHLIKLVQKMGCVDFSIILPLSSISSFGVYRILAEEYGLEQLYNYNSCWVSNKPCGVCLKCKRVDFTQRIIEACISGQYLEILNIIDQNKIPIDHLFGSRNIQNLLASLNQYNVRDISKEQYVCTINQGYDAGFAKLLQQTYKFQTHDIEV